MRVSQAATTIYVSLTEPESPARGRSDFRRTAKKLISGAFEFFFFLFLKAAH
ncbi:conserved hypothetical protein [Hyphomicrobium sp. GJ21]|jgi:hypothetical protein|nr:conserved hypothetical protein [Hyphomicrobium sp. GJ21]